MPKMPGKDHPSRGSQVGGDKVLGDKIVVGDVQRSAIAIGDGARVIYTNIERALSEVELEEQAEARERRRLAESLEGYVTLLAQQVEAAARRPAEGSPYKALLAYDVDDAAPFYGRSRAMYRSTSGLTAAPPIWRSNARSLACRWMSNEQPDLIFWRS